jgi:Tfp pilus assembly protein PilV
MRERANAGDQLAASMSAAHGIAEEAAAHGRFVFECFEYEGGPLLWREELDNVVCTAGKNVALDAYLAGSAYTVVGPFLGLISSVSFTAVAAADTMASHAGWLEAGNAHAPTYSGTRGTAAWSAASAGSKALSAALSFTFTGTGTVQGAFLTFGTGAVNTVDSTAGTLYSAGTFGAAQPVISGNVLNVSYTASL